MSSMLLNSNQFLFIISFDPSSEFDTVDHPLLLLESFLMWITGYYSLRVFSFSHWLLQLIFLWGFFLIPLTRSDSGLRPQSLLSLHYFGYHISFLDDFKNHFSMDSSQMDNCILGLISKLNISLFRYLIGISSSATPKSCSYHSLQIFSSESLLHISKWQIHILFANTKISEVFSS